ncbi:hypothetical protein GN958_ATG15153, partial [Phytophthora infestans]
PFASITGNVAKESVDSVVASTAVVKALSAAWSIPTEFMMMKIIWGGPTAYVHARAVSIIAENNPKTIAMLTKTVSEQLQVSAERV